MTSLTIASSIARADAYYRRQFAMRRRMLADSGLRALNEANALFLFDPEFARSNPPAVERWVDMVSSAAYDPAITAARIDMIVSHDALDDLPRITCPTQIIVGSRDFCAPPYFSRELAGAIPDARLTVLGHFVFLEQPDFVLPHSNGFLDSLALNCGRWHGQCLSQHRIEAEPDSCRHMQKRRTSTLGRNP